MPVGVIEFYAFLLFAVFFVGLILGVGLGYSIVREDADRKSAREEIRRARHLKECSGRIG